jgi:bifunctional DNase/RNase
MVQCFERAFREKEYFMIEVRVKGVARTPDPFLAGVILERLDNQEVLPIFIGMLEAESCFLVLANIARPRPQSHDLAKNLLDVLGAKIDKVVVTDLQDNSYYAVIHLLDKGGVQYEIDSRPSDAIALALRFDCPIFVEEQVFIKYAQQQGEEEQNRGTSLEEMEPSGSA